MVFGEVQVLFSSIEDVPHIPPCRCFFAVIGGADRNGGHDGSALVVGNRSLSSLLTVDFSPSFRVFSTIVSSFLVLIPVFNNLAVTLRVASAGIRLLAPLAARGFSTSIGGLSSSVYFQLGLGGGIFPSISSLGLLTTGGQQAIFASGSTQSVVRCVSSALNVAVFGDGGRRNGPGTSNKVGFLSTTVLQFPSSLEIATSASTSPLWDWDLDSLTAATRRSDLSDLLCESPAVATSKVASQHTVNKMVSLPIAITRNKNHEGLILLIWRREVWDGQEP